MKKKPKLRHLLFHSFGLGGLIGAVYLQALAFWDISTRGYFFTIEPNRPMLAIEILLTIYTAGYLAYLIQRSIRSMTRGRRP